MARTTNILTQIREQEISTHELRMVLRPSTLNYRRQFTDSMQHQLNHSTRYRIPWVEQLENIEVIDDEGIIGINNSTTSERRIEFMQSIINHENIQDNSYFILNNSTNQVRTYLHDLLIRSSNRLPINEENLYRVGNIFLYTISNMDIEGVEIRVIIQYLRENMVQYNTSQILRLLQDNIPIYDEYLNSARLATEEQLERRTEEFNQEINERILINRRRILYAGFGLVGSMALTSIGLPPVGGVIARTFGNISSNSTIHSSNDIVRLRDIWDVTLKKILHIIEK